MEINGATALVTGGAGALGRVIADHLHALGATILVVDRDREALAALPEPYHGHEVDILNPEAAAAAVATMWETHQRIDILVNCAGRIYSEPFANLMNPAAMMHDYARFRDIVAVNLDSVFIMTAAVVEHMIRRRVKGVVLNMSSISARGNAGQTAYSAAKAGVNAMTVAWAKELGPWGIRVNALAPGFIETDSTKAALNETILKHIRDTTPLRRLGKAEEVAAAAASLITNDFITGAVLDVNGGIVI